MTHEIKTDAKAGQNNHVFDYNANDYDLSDDMNGNMSSPDLKMSDLNCDKRETNTVILKNKRHSRVNQLGVHRTKTLRLDSIATQSQMNSTQAHRYNASKSTYDIHDV